MLAPSTCQFTHAVILPPKQSTSSHSPSPKPNPHPTPFHPKDVQTNTLSLTDAVAAGLSTLSVDAQKRAEKDAHKKALKAEAAEARELEKRNTSTIQIKRIERNKRKHVTCITGLEAFGLDIKSVAKALGKKFATGSSVTKVAAGGEEITVQGDLSAEIEEWLLDNFKDLPEENIELVEDKKKKKDAAGGGV